MLGALEYSGITVAAEVFPLNPANHPLGSVDTLQTILGHLIPRSPGQGAPVHTHTLTLGSA